MKTKEELNKLKEEVEAVNEKLAELTPEEIAQISGGLAPGVNGEPGVKRGIEQHGVDFIIFPQ